ncbi:MAG: ATP-binding protein [Bacillota bacterium]|nr:ATP-binding protein [Bacillota bacterium]
MQLSGEVASKGKLERDDVTLDRLAAVGQIAAGIAHEVRNPLTAVKGFLQLLKAEQPHSYLDIAAVELENALITLQNLLNVSKPDFVSEDYSLINLCSEIESILYLFQDQIYKIDIKKNFKNTDVKIYGKRNQLKKAFFNLLKNAFEAICDHGTVTIQHYIQNKNIVVSIEDTGVGIPKEKIGLLGTPFFTSKDTGTGMGLTQVYSTIYEHNGKIEVSSDNNNGTHFKIYFPIEKIVDNGVITLQNLIYNEKHNFQEFFAINQNRFNELIKENGKNVWETLKERDDIEENFLINSVHTVVQLISENEEYAILTYAKEQGKNWARLNLDLILIMEWFQILRKLYWDFLFNYHSHNSIDQNSFFELERRVNFNLDTLLKHFVSSYSECKNQLIQAQNEVIDELNVPIIPLSETMAILPIIGMVDTRRAKKIQESVLYQIYQQKIKHVIIDLSGVAYMDTAVLGHLFNIVNGIRIQGCKSVLTGIRPEITNTIVELGIDLNEKVETKGSLQQAIYDYNQLMK